MTIAFLLVHVLFLLFILFSVIAFFIGAPFVPTSREVVTEMIRAGHIGLHDVVADLGSGDGRLLLAAVRRGARGDGWEINPVLVLLSMILAVRSGVAARAHFHWSDYRKADISDASVVLLYSIAGRHTAALARKCMRELAAGSRVISYRFALPNLPLVRKTESGIYIYKIS